MSSIEESITPLPVQQWPSMLDTVRADMGGKPINVHMLMAHNPQLLNAWWNFRNYSVDGGSLGKRLGELVILRVGVHLKAWYEWGSHVDRAMRCGLTIDEINRVLERGIGPLWKPSEGALLRAVDELILTRRISPNCQAALAAHFTTAQVIDIVAIHGMYFILGCLINTWGLSLDTDVAERIQAHTSEEMFEYAVRCFHERD